jgi:SAM-dependent methyltransferase
VSVSSGDLESRIRETSAWYHTLELAPGVTTPGFVDWREKAAAILPADLSGRRCLDIGTYDGFWAFEMEKRGGDVVAIDLEKLGAADWPPYSRERLEREAEEWGHELGHGFRVAQEALGSKVERVICNVYDLSSEAVGGEMDFVFIGAVLLHLREPIRALEAIFQTLRPGGIVKLLESVTLRETLRSPRTPVARFEPLVYPFNWWRPNAAGLLAYLRACGFEGVRRGRFHRPPAKPEMRKSGWYLEVTATKPAA